MRHRPKTERDLKMRHWHKVIYTKAEIDHGQYVNHRNSGEVAFINAELTTMIDRSDVETFMDVDFMPSGDLLIHVLACYINRAMSGYCHLVGDTYDDIGRARWGLNRILERLGLAVEIKKRMGGLDPATWPVGI